MSQNKPEEMISLKECERRIEAMCINVLSEFQIEKGKLIRAEEARQDEYATRAAIDFARNEKPEDKASFKQHEQTSAAYKKAYDIVYKDSPSTKARELIDAIKKKQAEQEKSK